MKKKKKKRPMGRPPLPLDMKKIKVCISIDQDAFEYLEDTALNRSQFINDLIRTDMNYE